ncbi:MAG: arsenite methyltransferase [Gemmatimonadetes bacterium]|nr:arsenite methyltransferase [Gemmatimonadota bacterium]NNF12487.1 arsenite methyltransferase [Gemmatimonadota bacterium]NNL29604.1 arsenite methyltransferase [Gemmatimonadota bacterium]
MSEHTAQEVKKVVRERYARAATTGSSCCEPSCCADGEATTATEVSKSIGYAESDLAEIPEEANLGLGCGNPTAIASLTAGQTVLDLGSGAGIDCFLAARQVGPEGKVIGVDMTPEMLEKARSNATKGGYGNVEFRLGEIEALPVADESVDVIISNCVLNLSSDKGRVLREAYRVLRPGGRMVISDLVSDVGVPAVVSGSLDAVAGCLPTFRDAYLDEYRGAGFEHVRIVDESPYPASYLMDDDGVRDYLADHPEHQAEVENFASSIAGAHFEARKPV